MEFRLSYRGPLKSNGGVRHKHDLRQIFHKQLAVLWGQAALMDARKYMLNGGYAESSIRPIEGGSFVFAPLIQSKMYLVARLAITLLRPEDAGSLITQGGDIDNRLKTLFDALRMPKNKSELPPDYVQSGGESPHFFCLLEDDNLITGISVTTDRLLEPAVDPSEVLLLIHVTTGVTRATMENLEFGV